MGDFDSRQPATGTALDLASGTTAGEPLGPEAAHPEVVPAGPAGGLTLAPPEAVGGVGHDLSGPDLALDELAPREQRRVLQDRTRAAEELRDRFQVVPDDYAGERGPNTVSESEYQGLVANYSDIRLGRADLQLDRGMGREQRSQAFADIASILQTESGRTLLEDLSYHAEGEEARTTTIEAGRRGSSPAAGPEGVGRMSEEERAAVIGQLDSGASFDATVRYRPGENAVLDYPTDAASADWLPLRSDVALYHELVHAADITAGTRPGGLALSTVRHPVAEIDAQAGIAAAEYRAVGLGEFAEGQPYSENTYRSERREIGEGNVGERAGDDTMAQRTSYRAAEGNVMVF